MTALWERRADPATASASDPSGRGRGYYRAVVYARPDLRYLDDLDVAQLLSRADDELYTPFWATWGGLNDRFAFGAPRPAAAFGRRLEHFAE